jgi:hydrogenase expression/formation protein HypC
MCLAVPGKVLDIDTSGLLKMSKVDFGGIRKSVCVEWIEDLSVGDYVIVHVGCAISKMDEQEALTTLDLLRQMGDLSTELGTDEGTGKGMQAD